MAANYELKEISVVQRQGEKRFYPRIVSSGTVTTTQLANFISSATTFNSGEVKGLLQILSDTIADYLKEGYHIQLGDIGYLSLKLKSLASTENTKIRAESIRVDKVKFRTSVTFKRKLNGNFKRTPYPGASFAPPSLEISRKKLEKYLSEHPFITRKIYSSITGCNKYQGLKQLEQFVQEGLLKRQGSGSQLLFIRSEGK